MSWQKGIWEEVFGEPWSRDSQERVTRQYLSGSARCAFAGCKLPRLMGQVWCVEHKPKPLGSPTGVAPYEDFEEPES